MELNKFKYMALHGFSDEEMSFVMGISLLEMAKLAYNNFDFFCSITPSEQDKKEFMEELLRKQKLLEVKREKKRLWNKNKRENSLSFRIENAARARMTAALKGRVKKNSIRDLPYTTDELISHLESLFTKGMTLDNYGEWHIDHIKPCSLFDHTDKAQFQECWSLKNLQPLWKIDNLSKGDRYAGP